MPMADTYGALVDRFAEALNREFERDESLYEVDPAVAARVGEEVARVALGHLRWRLAAGECLTTSDLVEMWGITRQAIAKRVKCGSLLGLPGRGTTYFPRWQFDDALPDLRPVVSQILKIFGHHMGQVDPMIVASWAATPQPELRGRTPREWIQHGKDEECLLRAANAAARELAR
jgi:hypothetical protein